MIRSSTVGILLFAAGGIAITAALAGGDATQTETTAYSFNGQTNSDGSYSLDLSKPIFVRGEMPICPSESALEAYSPSNPNGCTLLGNSAPAHLLAIQTDGMLPATTQVATPGGLVRGWVDYSNLTN